MEAGLWGAKRIVKEESVSCWEDMIAHLRAFKIEVGVGGGMHKVLDVQAWE